MEKTKRIWKFLNKTNKDVLLFSVMPPSKLTEDLPQKMLCTHTE